MSEAQLESYTRLDFDLSQDDIMDILVNRLGGKGTIDDIMEQRFPGSAVDSIRQALGKSNAEYAAETHNARAVCVRVCSDLAKLGVFLDTEKRINPRTNMPNSVYFYVADESARKPKAEETHKQRADRLQGENEVLRLQIRAIGTPLCRGCETILCDACKKVRR